MIFGIVVNTLDLSRDVIVLLLLYRAGIGNKGLADAQVFAMHFKVPATAPDLPW